MIVVWVAALVTGIVAAALASRRAVGSALDMTEALGVSAGLVGVSVMAVGTDLPEIANSIIASASGHGDLNVGDSTGSALTQVTLVLALLLAAGGSLDLRQRTTNETPVAVPVGLMTVAALLLLAVLLADGRLQRGNGLLLVGAWIASLTWMHRRDRSTVDQRPVPGEAGGAAVRTIAWLAVVGVAATVTVRAFVEITDRVGVPELIASTVVLALGTSMPELVVDWTAIRRGAAALAVGDLFGSSLVDATLSVGVGPAVVAVDVSAAAITSTLIVAVGVAMATMAVALVSERFSLTGWLVLIYVASTAVLVALVGS